MGLKVESKSARSEIVSEMDGSENIARKREAQKRFDVWRGRIDTYILEKLHDEFKKASVASMRKCLSINISERIIDEMSSVYNMPPERTFLEASDAEERQIRALYKATGIDSRFKVANQLYNLYDNQDIVYIVPRDGIIEMRPLAEMDIDVIPDPKNPEKALAFIINTWESDENKSVDYGGDTLRSKYFQQDNTNQKIADNDDRKSKEKRMIVWTEEHHFTMNGEGDLITEVKPNPIGALPFVDISILKDGQFFTRRGSSTVDFSIDLGVDLSDLSNIVKYQSYAQAIMTSEKPPESFTVGTTQLIHIPLDPTRPESTGKFEYATPGNNIPSAISAIDLKIRMFLTSKGLDPKVINSADSSSRFSSGLERLIAMFDKFQATQDDFAIFEEAERKVFDLFRKWNNVLQGKKGDIQLNPELQGGTIGEQVKLEVQYAGPKQVVTDEEELRNIKADLEIGLISRVEAIAKRRGIDVDQAKEIMAEIDEQRFAMPTPKPPTEPPKVVEEPDVEELDDEEEIEG